MTHQRGHQASRRRPRRLQLPWLLLWPLSWPRLCLLLWLCAATGAWAVTPASVVIVSSEASPAYTEAADALVRELDRQQLPVASVQRMTVAELSATQPPNPQLYVALGAQAALALARMQPGVPVLCTLLPRRAFERALEQGGIKSPRQFGALVLDQPLARQLALVRLAMPRAQRLGVLWGPESKALAPALGTAATARGLELVQANWVAGESLFTGLRQILDGADVLLAMPDPDVFNAHTLQHLLLASFRAQVPMVAFSPAYVRAGALMAVYVTPAQLGEQAADMAKGVLQGKGLPAQPTYSRQFAVQVNDHVARSLGLTLDAGELVTRLRYLEGSP